MDSAGTTFGGGMFLSPGGRFGPYLAPDGALGGGGGGGGGNAGASGAPSGSAGAASGGGSGAGGSAPGGGGGYQPPQGMRLVKDEDWNTRDGFYSKAQEYGFKDSESLGRLKPLYETINKRQLDPAQLASMLSGEPTKQQQGQGQQQNQYLTAEELDRRLSERDVRTKAEMEWEGHQKALPTKIQSRVSETIKAAGLKPESGLGAMLTDAVNHRILQARMAAKWQDGHPLSGERLVAATDDIIEQVFTSGKFADSIKALRGEFLSSAAAANSGVSPTAAGTGGQAGGKGDKDEQDDRRARGIDTRSRDEKEAIVRRNREAAGSRR